MTAIYTNALHDKVHNQAIEIKRLKAEIERAKQAFLRLQTSRTAERRAHQSAITKLSRMVDLHKKGRISLANQVKIANNRTVECAKCGETFFITKAKGGCPYCNKSQ